MSAWLFWAAMALVAWTYAGYALLVALLARRHRAADAPADGARFDVTVVIAAYNEAARIAARVRDVLAQDYPRERLRVIVVSDGSTDGTAQAAAVDDARVRVIDLRRNAGKAAALNAAVARAQTALVVFTDVRQRFAPRALRRLVAPFADPRVGAVSGELEIVADSDMLPAPAGLYWKLESALRAGEARLGWLHGVSGAIHAVRRELYRAIPPGTLLDDMWIPLHVAFAGRRVAMARDAVARDVASAGSAEEYRRKLRTLAGNWQLIARLPRLLDPRRNPLFFPWFSHKLLRLIAPWALLAALVSSAFAAGPFYRFAFAAQCLAYAAAAFALLAPRLAARVPVLGAAGSFVMLNAAALLALPASLARDPRALWRKH